VNSINNFYGDMGGTEMLEPLKEAFKLIIPENY
jgi:hypothetical protein